MALRRSSKADKSQQERKKEQTPSQDKVSNDSQVHTRRSIERLGLGSLIGAQAEDTANLKAAHEDPEAVAKDLPNIMATIERKFNSGVYDAAVMPLVKEYLDELQTLAKLQNERDSIVAQRVSDAKEANKKAYCAVSEAREKRSDEIREQYVATQQYWSGKQGLRESVKQVRRDSKAQNKVDKIASKENLRNQKFEERLSKRSIKADRKMAQQQNREAEKERSRERKLAIKAQKNIDDRNVEESRIQSRIEAERSELDKKRHDLETQAATVREQKNKVVKETEEIQNKRRAAEEEKKKAEKAQKAKETERKKAEKERTREEAEAQRTTTERTKGEKDLVPSQTESQEKTQSDGTLRKRFSRLFRSKKKSQDENSEEVNSDMSAEVKSSDNAELHSDIHEKEDVVTQKLEDSDKEPEEPVIPAETVEASEAINVSETSESFDSDNTSTWW